LDSLALVHLWGSLLVLLIIAITCIILGMGYQPGVYICF
jgi:hypothetical protein